MTVKCFYCHGDIDPMATTTWRRIVGWERRGQAASRRGGSDISLREQRDEFACEICIARLKRGVNPAQEGLLA